jgi:cytochrome c peroxidase
MRHIPNNDIFHSVPWLGLLLSASFTTGCLADAATDTEADDSTAVETDRDELLTDAFANSTGTHRTFSTTGSVDEQNPFFKSIGTNGRTCGSCHKASAGWTITPSQIQKLFNDTNGLDPLFNPFDGTNAPNAPRATLDQRRQASSLLLNKGLIRVPLTLPQNREFDVVRIVDPYGVSTSSQVSVYRRPLPSANLKFLSGVMWDGREQTGATMRDRLLVQANDATRGHAQAARDLTATEAAQIVDFQLALFVAQATDNAAGSLSGGGATGSPQNLSQQQFFIGINDPLGGNPSGAAFNPKAFTEFDAWANLTGTATAVRRASINRGQQLFNTHPIRITGVRGVNNVVGADPLNGTCTTCHDSPNVGNHSVALPLDLGLTDLSQNGDNALPVFTLRNRSTGQTIETTDPGRALITGSWANVGTFKGPILHALSSRPPYFHNGTARTLAEVVKFYDTRFHIGFTAQESADLQAFLEAL